MSPTDCPHYEGCGAPLCALQPASGCHLNGEPVCRLLRESVKAGGPEHVAAYAGPEVASAVLQALPEVRSRWREIARKLDRAALSPINGAGRRPPERAV